MADKKPIERTVSLSIPLDKAAKIMGIKLEYDPWDDFYHSGHSKKDIKNMNLSIPSDLEGVEELFPIPVLSALESAERDGLAAEANRLSLRTIEDAFEKISAPMEYTGETADGEEYGVSVDASVKSAKVDPKEWVLNLEIENPEHLINGLIAGVGSVYPDLPVDEAASDADLISRIGWLKDFFEVFGERKPETDLDRISGDFDDEFFAEEIKAQLDMTDLAQAVDALEDYMDDAEDGVKAKDVAAKMSKLLGGNPSAKEILDAYSKTLDDKHAKKKSKLESKDDDDLIMCKKCKEWTSKKEPCCPGGSDYDPEDAPDEDELKESDDDFVTIFLKKDKISKDPRALMKMAAQLEKALNRDVAISGEGSLNIYTKDQALIKKAVELIGDDVVDKEELDVIDYDIVRNQKRDQKKVVESKELLEWAYKFKDKAEQIKQLSAFIGDMKASRIENDLNSDSLDDIFSHGRDEVEDQLTGLAGKVNGKDTQDVFKELSAGISDEEIKQAGKVHDVIVDGGWTNYSKSDYQDYAKEHGLKLESSSVGGSSSNAAPIKTEAKQKFSDEDVSRYLENWRDDGSFRDFNLALDRGLILWAANLLDGAGALNPEMSDHPEMEKHIVSMLKKEGKRAIENERKELLKDVEIWVDSKTNEHAFIPRGDVDYFMSQSDLKDMGLEFDVGYDKNGKPFKASELEESKKSGHVLWFNESIGRGSIADKDGCVYEIDTVVSGEAKIKSGQVVAFEEVNGPRTRFASKIKVIGG